MNREELKAELSVDRKEILFARTEATNMTTAALVTIIDQNIYLTHAALHIIEMLEQLTEIPAGVKLAE